ncbi:UNVERIFIED_CONTAM: Glycosyltransferases involved in cell wall biogenesis [Acetivibrio alkalicellulosi]
MSIEISIVVPVYNVEMFLQRCVKSLKDQTYKNIEIILVDDGSPDNCPRICDDYAKKDERIRVIHKKNGGLSDARNAGLKEAKGEYVLFVDSDDYIDIDACERFERVIALAPIKPEIVVGNARRVEKDKVIEMAHKFNSKSVAVNGEEYLKKELKLNTMYMAAWLNMYNRDFLISNNLFFKYGLIHEDEQFTPRVFLKAKKVIGTDITFYNYIIRDGSITTQENKVRNAEHLIETCKELEEVYNKIEDIELKSLLLDNLVNKYLNVFQVAGLHKKKYSYLIDSDFLNNKAYTSRNKRRVLLWKINKKLYFYSNQIYKLFR